MCVDEYFLTDTFRCLPTDFTIINNESANDLNYFSSRKIVEIIFINTHICFASDNMRVIRLVW